MPRTPIWKDITATLETEIAQGHYQAGDKLPTESELASRFGVNRHTVRRALSDMSDRGLVRSRRGAGVFVAASPTEYPLGRRVRFHQNIMATGRTPQKQVLRIETRPCDAQEAANLALQTGDPVVVYEGLSLSEGSPLAHFISLFPAARLPDLAATLQQVTSVTQSLRQCGIADYTRAQTRITAERASATQALHLGLAEGAPLLRTFGINIDPDGQPIEQGTTWFAGDRVTLTMAPE